MSILSKTGADSSGANELCREGVVHACSIAATTRGVHRRSVWAGVVQGVRKGYLDYQVR